MCEPVSGELDVSVQSQILGCLCALRNRVTGELAHLNNVFVDVSAPDRFRLEAFSQV